MHSKIAPQNMPANYWPGDSIGAISRTINKPCLQPSDTELKFKLNKESAAKNFCNLKKYGKDLGKAIEAQSISPLGYGLEFRPTSTLENIFNRHPNWIIMKNILDNGSNCPLEDLEEGDRWTDMEEAISFRNHKGAERNPVLLRSLVGKDVTHRYGLVLPLSKVIRIPGILLAPMNIMNQNIFDEHGRIIDKDRLTHDQSYKWGSVTSVISGWIRMNSSLADLEHV